MPNRESPRCPLCADLCPEVKIEEGGYRGHDCPRCNVIFTSPRPEPSDLVDLYGHGASHVSIASLVGDERFKRYCAQHTLRILERHTDPGLVLEIGCGAGFFLEEARVRGFDPRGIELDPKNATFVESEFGIPCETRSLVDGAFYGESFRAVYLCDVLSHFLEPKAELRAIHDRMVEGGTLLIETGNLPDLDAAEQRAYGSPQYPDHLFFFGERGVRELLRETGFAVVEVGRYSLSWNSRLLRLARRFRGRNALRSETALASGGTKPRSRVGARVRLAFRSLFEYASYWTRYRLGSIGRKGGRSQTLIFVARRRNLTK